MSGGITAKPTDHMNQLDTVRTLAVGMVIVTHWTPRAATFWFNGGFGVQLFFVISGFLITGILLDARRRAEKLGLPCSGILKSFYARRFLRIFPLFYGTLAVAFLLGYPTVRNNMRWLIPYLTNVLIAIQGKWIWGISHFWSLSVEEQFYLLWPILILFTSRRLLLPLIASAIVFAPVFRLVCFVLKVNPISAGVLPFASLDTLGLGAILALLLRNRAGEREGRALTILRVGSIAGCLVFLALNLAALCKGLPALLYWLSSAMIAPTVFGIVWLAARGVGGPLGWIMELSPLVYLGRISYALYIFHPFIPAGVSRFYRILGFPKVAILHPHFDFALNLVVLVGVSSLSWFFFEKRINDLKRFFPYVAPPAVDLHPRPEEQLTRA
jgi:peptidoglycan/LPS O-acetylase OafA/YrhL